MLAALGLAIFLGLKVKIGFGVVFAGVIGLPVADFYYILLAQLTLAVAPVLKLGKFLLPGVFSSERLT